MSSSDQSNLPYPQMDPANFMQQWPPAAGGSDLWHMCFNPQLNWPYNYGLHPQQQLLGTPQGASDSHNPMESLIPTSRYRSPTVTQINSALQNFTPPSMPADMLSSLGLPQLQQQQLPSCFITPPSDLNASRCSPPPTLLQEQQHLQLQPTPTGRPAAFNGTYLTSPADLTEENEEESGDDENQDPDRDQNQNQQLAAPVVNKRKRKHREENEEVAALATQPSFNPLDPTTEVFCRVPGRLSVVGMQRTFNVTVGEIERRTRAPECVALSLLGPLLKRGKVKGCGNDLKKLMETRRIPANSGGDKSCKPTGLKPPVSTLTALLEEEGTQLAADHRAHLASHFPHTHLARLIVLQQLQPSPAALTAAAADAGVAHNIIASLSSLFDECVVPSPPASPIAAFSLVTHGFGIEEARSAAKLFARFLLTLAEESRAHADRLCQYPVVYPEIPGPDAHMQREVQLLQMGNIRFAEVAGRLTLHSRIYSVSVAEITRRLRGPESLNLSTIGSFLRKGKTSNVGLALRDDLREHGIVIEQGRRVSAKPTSFTGLLEEEALFLARDLAEAIGKYLPTTHLAAQINARAAVSTAHAISQRRAALSAASRFAASLSETLTSLRLPVADRIPTLLSPYAHLLRNYSCLTHGYGPDVCVTWLEAFRKVFDAAIEMLPLTC